MKYPDAIPTTIFLQWNHEGWHEEADGVTWSTQAEFDDDIEYIRKDLHVKEVAKLRIENEQLRAWLQQRDDTIIGLADRLATLEPANPYEGALSRGFCEAVKE